MKQPSLFGTPEYEITKPIRLIELFGGVGSQSMGLRDIGAKFEHYRLVEFDPYPVKSYNSIFGTNFEPVDIRNIHGSDLGIVDTNIYIYMLILFSMSGFKCCRTWQGHEERFWNKKWSSVGS